MRSKRAKNIRVVKFFTNALIFCWLIAMYFLITSVVKAEIVTTNNLLSNNFSDSTWTGNNKTSLHGTTTVAGINNQSISSKINVIDDTPLHKIEMNNGFTSIQSGEVWYWNSTANQSVVMSQSIVGNSGSNVSQTLTSTGVCSQYNGCSYKSLGNNTIIVGTNTETNFDITSAYTFNAPNTSGHNAADLKNLSLTLSYTLPEFVEEMSFETFDNFEFEKTDWEENIFDDFYMEEEEFFFPSTDLTFNPPEEYIMEYEDFEMQSAIFFYETPSSSFEDGPLTFEYFSEEMFYEEMIEPGEMLTFTEESEEFFLEEMSEEKELIEEELPKEEEEEEFISEDEFIIEQEEMNEEPDELVEEKQIEITEEPEELIEEIKSSVHINVQVKTKLDMMKLDNELKMLMILKEQPLLIDTKFYSTINLYPNQLVIVDKRVIYENVQFAKDPLILYETKLRDVKERQYQKKIELGNMVWIN